MQVATRDDFSAKVKRSLAERVAYRCSNPDCRNQTLGPQETGRGAVRVGFAAHVKAAAPGGKRYDNSQTPEARSAEENGIWLCGTCAKLIDSDESRFQSSLLQSWKTLAVERARAEIGKPPVLEAQQVATVHVHTGDEKRPQLDTFSGIAHSGGAEGHFLIFELSNDGNDAAFNVICSLDDISIGTHEVIAVPAKLSSGEIGQTIKHRVDSSPLFLSKAQNPRITFRYESKEGSTFKTSRALIQEPRADGRFNLTQGEDYADTAQHIQVELEDLSFNRHSKTVDGIVDSFSITIRLLFRNLSKNAYQIKKVKTSFIPLDGYESTMFGNTFTEVNDLPGRTVITKTLQFSLSLYGRGQGSPESKTLFEESKCRALTALSVGRITLRFEALAVSVIDSERIEEDFNLTESIIANLRTPA